MALSRILIVDDNSEQANILSQFLQTAGFASSYETNSELAEKRIAEYQPDVVVLDIMMPKLDGLTLLKRIRDHGDWQGIKVIIHSAKSFAVDRRRALELGADLFLAKPTSANKFIASIRGLIEVVAH